MNKKILPFLLGGALVAGCNQPPAADTTSNTPAATASNPASVEAQAPVGKDDAVAIVDGTVISQATLKALEDDIAKQAPGQKFPKQQLLEELIQRELLVKDAQNKKLDQTPEYKEQIKMAERSLLSRAVVQDYLKANPVTDADLKTVYDKEVAAKMSGTEYKARHILVKTEEEAKKIIAELGKGAKFEDLAKKHSLDPSKDQGGDLGWFTEGQMVEPFSKAVVALEKGKFTQTPVKTQFGWHVILREDSRAQTPPAFDAVKEQLKPMVQQQKVQGMLDGLRKAAKVEILIPLEEPKAEAKPAEAAPAPAEAAKPEEAAKAPETAPAPEAQPSEAPAPAATEAPATSEVAPVAPAATTEDAANKATEPEKK